LLDYFKSLGSLDPLFGKTNNLQFEFIPRSSNLAKLIEMSKKEHIVIISYWSNHLPEIGRIAEVIASIRLGKYVNGISDREKLLNYIFKQLNRGEGALGYKRVEDKNTVKVIRDLIGETSTDSEVFFLRNSFLKIIQKYGMVLGTFSF